MTSHLRITVGKDEQDASVVDMQLHSVADSLIMLGLLKKSVRDIFAGLKNNGMSTEEITYLSDMACEIVSNSKEAMDKMDAIHDVVKKARDRTLTPEQLKEAFSKMGIRAEVIDMRTMTKKKEDSPTFDVPIEG
jgi:hypothetical protein